MDRIVKPIDKESMRMAMLKHEETFKEQVYELHRLYEIQKMLMNNMKSNGPYGYSANRWNMEKEISLSQVSSSYKERREPQKPKKLDLEQPAEEYTAVEGGVGVLEIEDESNIQLTLGPSSYSRRKKDERALTSDSGPSFSSSSTESSHMKRTSTGAYKRMDTREELTGHEWGLIQVPDMHPSFPSGRKNIYNVEEQLRQEKLNRPPWLFHVFSMNMT
ncbi:uncharacterized protein LOC122074955 [Macadamia integrifolia]|uniref:uncharacterized protein LOC122074955 n=1 Tax=Macadamia integrifolia TaxID=60698 RepID=UPI001C4F1009|nr:uncharacterized protein LOC122074955 [Macadamia integrifolia]XP_042495880.1 uncharacterized protein LOC122074955 [Macadamia integrifolia]XP_042495881.1 uncharacterized protein LOC122074955 [Macadamia integrifolia]XP_042495882.1 uncharacterized protein LOC122074955 [Macadamia integrifolia]XP_042495884.1 uncharacterized protein LOC122074955 [Macadamia integrifolia]